MFEYLVPALKRCLRPAIHTFDCCSEEELSIRRDQRNQPAQPGGEFGRRESGIGFVDKQSFSGHLLAGCSSFLTGRASLAAKNPAELSSLLGGTKYRNGFQRSGSLP